MWTAAMKGLMTIAELIKNVAVVSTAGPLNRKVEGIAYDSRQVKKGFLFVAIRGFYVDGHDYLEDAINRGAIGVVVESKTSFQTDVAVIEVDDTRSVLSSLSVAFFGNPSQRLSLIGITGTNGKTSTTYIVKSILEAWGKKTGLIGTNQYITGVQEFPAFRTTPESTDLQSYLKDMVENGLEYGVIEVSSHALALKRIEGCSLKVAVFTNFSQDHLDFHGSMENYFAAKCKIFELMDKDGKAVLNCDDPFVRTLTEKLSCRIVTCGIENDAMIMAKEISEYTERSGLSCEIQTPYGDIRLNSQLLGMNNVYNVLMSVGVAYSLGVDSEAIIKGVENVKPIEGRFEVIKEGQGFLCIVDYAHTEEALKKLIEETRRIVSGRVITVFGCGGDRDRTKRPRMGRVATELSDFVILTSDNPRTEDPMDIIKDITRGIQKNNFTIEPDRRKAIEKAISAGRAGDAVLIAGKGHEDYQEIKGVRYRFSDREVVREEIRRRMEKES
jgi:UDP-N-acetylmuramoyl-L-alanyl-D-glutamate--2,6-diaminopimelate ligase